MSLELIADLREKLGFLDKMKINLAYSHAKVGHWWRVDAPFEGWSDDQFGIIDGMDEWLAIRDLRNAAAHDYSATEADRALHFHSLLQHSEYLFQTPDSLKRFVATAYPINNGKHIK